MSGIGGLLDRDSLGYGIILGSSWFRGKCSVDLSLGEFELLMLWPKTLLAAGCLEGSRDDLCT